MLATSPYVKSLLYFACVKFILRSIPQEGLLATLFPEVLRVLNSECPFIIQIPFGWI